MTPRPHAASSSAPPLQPGIDLSASGASVLQAHLERCFLRGELADVKVTVDRFGRSYRLHKVVLAQAAFFESLFQGGWSEEEGSRAGPSEPTVGATMAKDGKEINLQMDDPNISRAAFEVLLARLYATSGPPLWISPATHPTPLHPLSPSFPSLPSTSAPLPTAPENAQPATPRFLLSLLATSLFLGMPGVTQGVTTLVIGSLSPWSIGHYLGFAIGRGVGPWAGEEWEVGGGAEDGDEEEKGARGLEELGVRVEESVDGDGDAEMRSLESEDGEGEGEKSGGRTPKEGVKMGSPQSPGLLGPLATTPGATAVQRPSTPDHTPAITDTSASRPTPSRASLRTTSSSSSLASSRISALREDDASSSADRDAEQQLFFYGPTSNKIGEACACWLARWGVDVLDVEERLYLAAKKLEKSAAIRGRRANESGGSVRFDGLPASAAKGSLGKGKGKASLSSSPNPSYFPYTPGSRNTSTSGSPHPHRSITDTDGSPSTFPPIFSLGGLPATWIRAVVSSDAFFVKNEMQRYSVAKRVYDLRRAQRDERKNADGKETRRGSFESDSEDEDEKDEELDEESEFDELFAKGIYYSHMTFEELAIISHDINPATSLPYAPLAILQTSNWSQQELKTRILSSASSYGSGATSPTAPQPLSTASPSPADASAAELGISSSTTGIVHELGKVLEREARRRRRSRSASGSSPYGTSTSGGSGTPTNKHRTFGSISSLAGSPFQPSGSSPLASPTGPSFSALSLLPPVSATPSAADTKLYWPVPGDDTHRTGDYGGFLPLPPTGLANSGTVPSGGSAGGGGGRRVQGAASEQEHFGIGKAWRSGREILEGDLAPKGGEGGEQMWTKYEPFRFSAEFWGVDQLKEKQREYSSTVFYSGSYFNVYAQTIKKKDRQIQLGIYLHRQSMLEPTPIASSAPLPPTSSAQTSTTSFKFSASSPNPSSPPGSSAVLSTSAPTNPSQLSAAGSATHLPITRSLSGTSTPLHSTSPPTVGLGTSPSSISSSSIPSAPVSGPSASFRDPRKVIKCYFSISCPSALGTALTRFSSAPDVFSVSQSWGWKSQSLRSEEYLSVLPTMQEATAQNLEDGVLGWVGTIDPSTFGKLQSLRATVVVGLV